MHCALFYDANDASGASDASDASDATMACPEAISRCRQIFDLSTLPWARGMAATGKGMCQGGVNWCDYQLDLRIPIRHPLEPSSRTIIRDMRQNL